MYNTIMTIMKSVILALHLIGLVCSQQLNCAEPIIELATVICTNESIFLRWKTDKICSYEYDVWYSEVDEQNIKHVKLEKDDSKLNVTQLIPNTNYTFLITSTESSHNTTFYICTAPSVVTNLRVTDAELNAITLTWDPPEEGSGDGNWSEACVILHDDNGSEQCNPINGNEYRFTGLASCTNYTFTVTSVGYNLPNSTKVLKSAEISITHPTSKTVPGKVTGLIVRGALSDGVGAHWSHPMWYDAPHCVTHYNVTVQNENNTYEYMVERNRTTFFDIGFDMCTLYNVSVVSVGENDTTSDPVYGDHPVKTGPMSIPQGAITVTNSTPTWVEISWEPSTVGVECLFQYVLIETVTDDTSAPISTINKTKDERSHRFTDFEPCEARTIYLYTTNEEGVYSYATSEVIHSTGEDPGAITNFTVDLSEAPYHTEVTWVPPNTTSKCAQVYRACVRMSYPNFNPSCYTSLTNNSYSFYNLRVCTNFTFTVAIWGPFGMEFGTWETTEIIPYSVRTILSGIDVKPLENNLIFVLWNLEANTGTDCIQFFEVCWSVRQNSSCVQMASSATSLTIPENIARIIEITVKAVFIDDQESNKLSYAGSGSITLLLSNTLAVCCLILHIVCKVKLKL